MSKSYRPARRPRIEEKNPLLAQKAVLAYGETGSLEQTAAKTGLAPNTVKAILTRNPGDFLMAKKLLMEKALLNADRAADVAASKADQLTAMQAFIASKVASQQAIELGNDPAPTITIEQVRGMLELQRLLAQEIDRRGLKAEKVIEADVNVEGSGVSSGKLPCP